MIGDDILTTSDYILY